MTQYGWLSISITVTLAGVTWYANRNWYRETVCYRDFENGGKDICRSVCPHRYFSLEGMTDCIPWLSCADFGDIAVLEKIGGGAVKTVHLANWRGKHVALNRLAEPLYGEDFQHGLRMLSMFHPHPFVTQLIGYCKDEFVTEYQKLRSAEHLLDLLESEKLRNYNTLSVRFGLCINYVELLVFLHNSSHGTRVMCDSNDLAKTLNQLLVTPDLHLILNDLDALPAVTPESKIKCGHREIVDDFAAPEQRWPFPNRPFEDISMPPYDEKSDVWKIPDVCWHFLGNHPDTRTLVFHLFKTHQKCKSEDPKQRISAAEVLSEYREIYRKFHLQL